jgi:hypothetical protein
LEFGNIATLSTILLAVAGASIAAIASYIVTYSQRKSEVHINVRTASGARITIDGSNISDRQIKEIMRILEEQTDASSTVEKTPDAIVTMPSSHDAETQP